LFHRGSIVVFPHFAAASILVRPFWISRRLKRHSGLDSRSASPADLTAAVAARDFRVWFRAKLMPSTCSTAYDIIATSRFPVLIATRPRFVYGWLDAATTYGTVKSNDRYLSSISELSFAFSLSFFFFFPNYSIHRARRGARASSRLPALRRNSKERSSLYRRDNGL